jgi:type I restriction-modification system DNA methylase subunit
MSNKENKINQDEINQILWQVCDTFRGILNSATYMNYLLPMLFLTLAPKAGALDSS